MKKPRKHKHLRGFFIYHNVREIPICSQIVAEL